MNRLLVAALAACLAQLALGCAVDRTEIYEPAEEEETVAAEKIDTARVSDDTPIAYPVPTDVAAPVDRNLAIAVDDHRDWLTPGVKLSEVMPPAYDIAANNQLPNVEGVIIPTIDIDPYQQVSTPSLGLSPLLVVDPPPTYAQAAAVPPPF
ncbi:MAG: hypothetical protein KIT84_36795 [Labilithrix sp.]|nr:hypothetical protein [Labilithrix sp.]MCW5816615.1 hypothetical protein [Labilithrix sp.]